MTAKIYGLYIWSTVFHARHTEHSEVSSDFLVNPNQYINICDNRLYNLLL